MNTRAHTPQKSPSLAKLSEPGSTIESIQAKDDSRQDRLSSSVLKQPMDYLESLPLQTTLSSLVNVEGLGFQKSFLFPRFSGFWFSGA